MEIIVDKNNKLFISWACENIDIHYNYKLRIMKEVIKKYVDFANKVFAGEKLPKFLLVDGKDNPISCFREINKDGVILFDSASLRETLIFLAIDYGRLRSLEEIKRLICFVEKTELAYSFEWISGILIDLVKGFQKAFDDKEKKAEFEEILDFLKTRLLKSNRTLCPEVVAIFAHYYPNSLPAIYRRLDKNEDYSLCFKVLTSDKPTKEFAIYLMENGYVANLGVVLDWLERENFKDEELKEFKLSVLRIVSDIIHYDGNFSLERCKKLRKLFWGGGHKIFDDTTIIILFALIMDNVCNHDNDEEYSEIVNDAVNDLIEIVRQDKSVNILSMTIDAVSGISINENARMDELCVELAGCTFENFEDVIRFQKFLASVFDMDDEKERIRGFEIYEIAQNNFCNSKKKN